MNEAARYRWIAANILPHEGEMRGWLRRRLGALSSNDVDDLVQEAFARIWAVDFSTIRNGRAYLYATVRHLLAEHARRYEIRPDATSIFLSGDLLRARYRDNPRHPKVVTTKLPLRYEFEHFTFVSQEIKKGSRLRLVISPVNSLGIQKNYNSGGEVPRETIEDSKTVTVTLYHDRSHLSALYIPFGQPEPAERPDSSAAGHHERRSMRQQQPRLFIDRC